MAATDWSELAAIVEAPRISTFYGIVITMYEIRYHNPPHLPRELTEQHQVQIVIAQILQPLFGELPRDECSASYANRRTTIAFSSK